ncbi:hypothetical protein V8J82_23310 [Gymnodinialimonas sp. 2305UL16-5]|uniref:hypothetical protein n=1 Tax=Gymnodinialimonas mytili TaxID=3126503 RepID=UPI00309FCC38
MTRKVFNRRNILIGAVIVVGGGGMASALACRPDAESAALGEQLDRLRAALDDIVAPERIGRAYRAERGLSAVTAEFLDTPYLSMAAAYDCPAALRAHLRDQIRADFVAGDVVVADRFVVARSECILAALLA